MLLAVGLLAFIGPLIGLRGLWEPDEGRYVSVALRMLDRGDFLVPYLDAEHPHLSKPPVTYWALAASFATLGRNERAARAPNVLAFVATGLLVAWLASLLRLRAPFLAAAVWATMLLPFIGANAITTDTLLVLFETLAVAGFVWSRADEQRRRAGTWIFWMALAAAFLTKGPPALVVLVPVVAMAATGGRGGLRALFAPVPVLAFLAVALGWFAYLIGRHPALAHYFLFDEFAERLGTGMHHRNPGWRGLFLTYLPTLLVGFLPWSLIGAWLWIRRRPDDGWAAPDARRLIAVWFLAPLVLFALAQSRLPLYLLALGVPVALWVAAQLPEIETVTTRRAARVGFAAWVMALVAMQAASAFVETDWDARRYAMELRRTIDVARVDELVFVDRPAAYGLRFYLPVEIEKAYVEAGVLADGFPNQHGVCEELRETRSPVLVVGPAHVARVIAQAQGCGFELLERGQFRGNRLLGVRRRAAG